jgi:NAD(P)-dependent dehydrogenase (short-subunit alcohol dehydrogenase family)
MSKPVAVVTGSSSGIGAATVRKFAQNGWNVAINYSRDEKAAEIVADQCRAHGADVLVLRADVASDADCRRIGAQVGTRWSRADVLVNNAGRTKFVDWRNLEGLSGEDFASIYAVNVVGAYQMTRALVPLLQKQEGAGIVNVSSIASTLGLGSSLAYAASKGALNTLTLGLARSLGPKIRVNAVAPGMVDGEWLRKGLGLERFETVRQGYEGKAALESIVTPEDVAEAIYWLGAGARKTTGELIYVDGGMKAGKA